MKSLIIISIIFLIESVCGQSSINDLKAQTDSILNHQLKPNDLLNVEFDTVNSVQKVIRRARKKVLHIGDKRRASDISVITHLRYNLQLNDSSFSIRFTYGGSDSLVEIYGLANFYPYPILKINEVKSLLRDNGIMIEPNDSSIFLKFEWITTDELILEANEFSAILDTIYINKNFGKGYWLWHYRTWESEPNNSDNHQNLKSKNWIYLEPVNGKIIGSKKELM